MRRQPYTYVGLRLRPCVKCDQPASEQWNVRSCRAGVNWGYLPLCDKCDADLNEIVLDFFGQMPRKAVA